MSVAATPIIINMPIVVRRDSAGWVVDFTPAEAISRRIGPLEIVPLIDELIRQGCHSTDVSDAVYAADPKVWREIFDPSGKYTDKDGRLKR